MPVTMVLATSEPPCPGGGEAGYGAPGRILGVRMSSGLRSGAARDRASQASLGGWGCPHWDTLKLRSPRWAGPPSSTEVTWCPAYLSKPCPARPRAAYQDPVALRDSVPRPGSRPCPCSPVPGAPCGSSEVRRGRTPHSSPEGSPLSTVDPTSSCEPSASVVISIFPDHPRTRLSGWASGPTSTPGLGQPQRPRTPSSHRKGGALGVTLDALACPRFGSGAHLGGWDPPRGAVSGRPWSPGSGCLRVLI